VKQIIWLGSEELQTARGSLSPIKTVFVVVVSIKKGVSPHETECRVNLICLVR
jgi:hypothetical protein